MCKFDFVMIGRIPLLLEDGRKVIVEEIRIVVGGNVRCKIDVIL